MGIIALCALLFLPSTLSLGIPPGPFGSALRDSLHLPLFAALTGCLFLIATGLPFLHGSRRLAIATAACTAFVLALGSEWFQGMTGRSMSATDLVNDLLGIAVMAAFLGWVLRPHPRVRLALTLAVVALALAAVPVFSAWKAEGSLKSIFPDLGGFSSSDAYFFWKPQGVARDGTETLLAFAPGNSTPDDVLYIKGAPAAWSGVSKSFPAGTRDWSAFVSLSLTLENLGPPFALGIRIDSLEDSVSAAVPVPTGVTTVPLPFDSALWGAQPPPERFWSDIRKMVIHSGPTELAHSFIVNDIRLLPSGSDP